MKILTPPETHIRPSVQTYRHAVRRWAVETLLPALIGLLIFQGMFRIEIVQPGELQWLGKGDAAQHLIGLQYFVREPWQWPPGKLTTYGDGVVTSIVYTDSLPLIAIPWKALVRCLGITSIIQPFGLFIAAGFCLQGFFGYRILRRLTGQRWLSLLGTPLLVLSPPMFARIPEHFGLGAAHWIILCALWLLMRSGAVGWKKNAAWMALLGTALGVHFYLFCMATALYGAALLNGVRRGRVSLIRLAVYGTIFAALVAGCGWLFGYFVPMDPVSRGYGEYKFNVLAFFNPTDGWSALFPAFRGGAVFEYEGFAWLGAGLVLLGVIVGLPGREWPRAENRLRLWRSPTLWGVLAVLLAVAITPSVNVGSLELTPSLLLTACVGGLLFAWAAKGTNGLELATIHQRLFASPMTALATVLVVAVFITVTLFFYVPGSLLGILRSSGRLAWPAFYWLACWIIARTVKSYSKPAACLLLVVCIEIQAMDMAPRMEKKCEAEFPAGGLNLDSSPWPSEKIRDALGRFCGGKKRLWIVTKNYVPENCESLGLLAIQNGMTINRARLARFPGLAEEKHQAEIRGSLERGIIPGDVVYAVYPDSRNLAEALIKRIPGEVEFEDEKGWIVLTRAAHPSEELAAGNREKWRSGCMLPLEDGKPILFGKGGEADRLRGAMCGFSDIYEPTGVLTTGSCSWVNIKAPKPGTDLRLAVKLLPLLDSKASPGQFVRIVANGELVAEWSFAKFEEARRELTVPGRVIPDDGLVSLRFEIAHPISLKSLGINTDKTDDHLLGLRLMEIETF